MKRIEIRLTPEQEFAITALAHELRECHDLDQLRQAALDSYVLYQQQRAALAWVLREAGGALGT